MSLIEALRKKNFRALFTTPSHGGKFFITHKFYNWYKFDISEVDAYNPQEALKKAEEKAGQIYGTKYTKFLINGSSSGVIASVLTCARNKKVLIWDKAHRCHKNACVLANAEIIEYSLPFDNELGVYKAITSQKVKELIETHLADAIIITSPTYEGFVADIKAISEICKSNNVKLIVDEAHGALYPFSDKLPDSAVNYADYTIQSLHKTAGGINPTAVLHSNDLDIQPALDMITTTSPSYPMLATIEANINYLNSAKGRKKIDELIKNIEELRLQKYNDDITKILIKKDGLSGEEISEILYEKYNIEDEKVNSNSVLLLCGLGCDKKKLKKLSDAMQGLKHGREK